MGSEGTLKNDRQEKALAGLGWDDLVFFESAGGIKPESFEEFLGDLIYCGEDPCGYGILPDPPTERAAKHKCKAVRWRLWNENNVNGYRIELVMEK